MEIVRQAAQGPSASVGAPAVVDPDFINRMSVEEELPKMANGFAVILKEHEVGPEMDALSLSALAGLYWRVAHDADGYGIFKKEGCAAEVVCSRHDGGDWYFSMTYVPNGTKRTKLDGEPLAWSKAGDLPKALHAPYWARKAVSVLEVKTMR